MFGKLFQNADYTEADGWWRKFIWSDDAGNQLGGLPTFPAPRAPLGYEQITDLSSAAALTVPTGATQALIRVAGQPVRWRDDGTSPDSSTGFPLAVDDILSYDGDLSAIEFIETSSGAALDICYYS